MRRARLVPLGTMLAILGCGDGAVGPGGPRDGRELASRFEHLADSVDGGGYSPTAEALRHAADIVRLTGHATPVTVVIDGQPRPFLAVAEQIDFPSLECAWPSDTGTVEPGGAGTDSVPGTPPPGIAPGECSVVGTWSMRTLIAWEPENLAEVVRIVADPGSNGVEPGVPDVMTGLPTTPVAGGIAALAGPDSVPGGGGGSGGHPGFMGEYLVRDVGSWWAVEGTQANALLEIAGSCTADRATFDWAEFACEAARFRFQFTMRVEPIRYEPLMGAPADPTGPEGSHTLALGSSAVDGVRLTVVAWSPPPLPPPPEPQPVPPPPIDSSGTGSARR